LNSARTFVLVHGAWHGGWCWGKILPLLEARGHRVLAPDLPSMGEDQTDPATITLEVWTNFIADLVARHAEPVILVGHSRAGVVISQAAQIVPERISRLVYLSGYLLPSGTSVADAARGDTDSLVPPNMIPEARGLTCTLRANIIREALFGQCSDEVFADAVRRLSPEPLKPLVTPLNLSDARFGRVSRAYFECLQDRTVTLAAQRRMQAVLPCDPVFSLDSDHSPFLSHPARLADLLGRL
jgi:pimeloyl-ACP methyl ester carboxylesterase